MNNMKQIFILKSKVFNKIQKTCFQANIIFLKRKCVYCSIGNYHCLIRSFYTCHYTRTKIRKQTNDNTNNLHFNVHSPLRHSVHITYII